MPKYNIQYTIKGGAGILKNVPNKSNPLYGPSLAYILEQLGKSEFVNQKPDGLIQVIGVSIEELGELRTAEEP